MRKLLTLVIAAVIAALVPTQLSAQDAAISGQVVDRNSQLPLPDARVTVVGTQRGAVTDREGRYVVRGVPPGSYNVRAQRVGYAPDVQRVSVAAGMTATTNFALGETALALEEVVVSAVTGQEERRVQSGTNIGRIDVGEMNKGPITKMADVLQGRVAGVNLLSPAGGVGTSQKIRIRGANSLSLSNEPLLYMDGIRVSNSKGGFTLGGQDYSRLNDINPEEIENIDVLKGPAAAALYGSAAANGVILITTKRGRAGRPQWNLYLETARMKDENDWPLNYAALQAFDATQPRYVIDDGGILNIRTFYGPTAPYAYCPNYLAATGSCTQDVLISFDQFRDARTTPFFTGTRGKVGLSVAGGSDNVTYFMSGDQDRENGVMRPNDLERISLRTNVNARIGSQANATITGAYIRTDTRRVSTDNSVFSQLINALVGPAEYLPGMESDTVRTAGDRLGSFFGWNNLDQRKVFSDQLLDRLVIGANATYTPLSWLRLNGNAGLDYFGRFDQQTINPNELPLAQSYIKGWRDAARASNYLWTANASAAGTFELRDALVSTTTLGAAYERQQFRDTECYGEGIPAGTQSCAATTSLFAVDEDFEELRTVGGFFRQELAFADRLFLSGAVRADNNSGLVRDVSGLAYYPAFNGSWVLSQERFFPSTGFLSLFRLRAGWGQAGQRPGFGDAETFFGPRVVQVGAQEVPALILTRAGNPNLKVERTTEVEGGFDAAFLDDRISAEFTAFRRRSKDALVRRNLAPSAGLTTSVFQNLGSVLNTGTEWGLGANVLDVGNFRLDARLVATTLHNRIEALGEDIAPIQFNRGRQQHREDFPIGGYFARPIKWNDANGDGKLSRTEVTVDTSKFLIVPEPGGAPGALDTLNVAFVGSTLPTNTQGLSFDLTFFRNITLSTLFERRAGHYQLNETEFFRCRTQDANPFFGMCAGLADPNASLKSQAAVISAKAAFPEFGATPYLYMEEADFVKWRELSLRIGLPEAWAARMPALRGAALSLSGRNLKTWTDYTGIDPEINETGGIGNVDQGGASQGEFDTQGPVRTFSIRLDFRL
jgi:TonB-linked SusC/RagA family outer membrane protein